MSLRFSPMLYFVISNIHAVRGRVDCRHQGKPTQ